MQDELRWKQRFRNFQKALVKLDEAVGMESYSEMERESLIKRFEYTLELGWKTLQDLLYIMGYIEVRGPKPVIKQAFLDGYVSDGDGWIEMLDARNLASHTYDEITAEEIAVQIKSMYFALLNDLHEKLTKESNQ